MSVCCVLERNVDNINRAPFPFLLSLTMIWSLSLYIYNIRWKNLSMNISDQPAVSVCKSYFFFRLYAGRDFFKSWFYSPTIYVTIGPSHSWLHLASDPLEIYTEKMIYLRLLMWSANGNMFSYIFLSTGFFFRFSPLFLFCCLLFTGGGWCVFSSFNYAGKSNQQCRYNISYQVYYST